MVEPQKCSTRIQFNTSGTITTEESECILGWNYTYPDHEYFPQKGSIVSEVSLYILFYHIPPLFPM